ncbi:MAG: cytochrome c oxidase subunit 3 [Planctomycetes bacterium]|nr:cytochrome c oxidase subunit 3 [Planctomycetota bacterium]MCB9917529.1 cytochrome c oxidase subunit 3 [Planctomycetota bacterium]
MLWNFGFLHGHHEHGGDGSARSPSGSSRDEVGAGRFAFKLGLASIGSLFLGCLIAFVTIRFRADTWREAGMPKLPLVLWLSTALLVLTSVLTERAYRGPREQRGERVRFAFLAALGFCVAQIIAWVQWSLTGLPPNAATLYAFSFYMLTAVHGLHVIAGLVLLHIVKKRQSLGTLRIVKGRSEFLRLTAQYWHFLGAVWLVMWIALEIAAS